MTGNKHRPHSLPSDTAFGFGHVKYKCERMSKVHGSAVKKMHGQLSFRLIEGTPIKWPSNRFLPTSQDNLCQSVVTPLVL